MSLWSRVRAGWRSVVGPNTPGTPADWMVRMFGGQPATAGTQVNESTALSWTALMCGVRFLAETLAALPLRVCRRLEPRGKTVLLDHPIAQLVRAPNPEQSWFEFVELMETHAILWGNAYAQIVWSNGGEPLELWPLNPDRVQLRRDRTDRLVYQVVLPRDEVSGGSGPLRTLIAEDVLHIRGPSRWGLLGERIATVHREAIGLGLATEEFAARFFGSGMHASGILEHPGKLSKDAQERLRESVDRQSSGLSRAHRLAILEEGMKWQQITIEPEKAQFLGVRQFQITEAARILRVPPHLLYDLSRATFTNIEHQGIEVVVFTLLPWARRWEARLDKQLVSTKSQNTVYTKFGLDGLLRGDTQTRYAAYAAARNTGWLSVNDIRELEDMNPVPDGDGYLQPVNMQPLGTVPAPRPALLAGDPQLGPAEPGANGGENGSRHVIRSEPMQLSLRLEQQPLVLNPVFNLSLPPTLPTPIEVRNEITVPAAPPAPVIVQPADVAPPAIIVRNAVPPVAPPAVTVLPAEVTVRPVLEVHAEVTVPPAQRIAIERDALGNVVAVTRE